MTAALSTRSRAPRAGFHPLRVGQVDRLTEDAVAVTFEVPPELREVFAFEPGQALTLRRAVDGRDERRSYSICAATGQPLRIGVRELPGGGLFSSWLAGRVRVGDMIDVAPPSGRFRADPSAGGRHLCVAAGSGITPMMSVIGSLLAEPGAEVTLLYGNRTTSTVMFADELADLKDRYGGRFCLVHVLSREPRDVELFSGRLDGARLGRIVRALVPVDGLDHVWLCGPFGMVTEARGVLEGLGVASARVHTELFAVDTPPEPLRHPDQAVPGDAARVTVVLDGRSTTVPVPRDASILDGVATARADVPFACRGGVCGTCRAVVRRGEVDMRRNYALEEAEVDAGFVLTCQTRPVTDEVEVDFDA